MRIYKPIFLIVVLFVYLCLFLLLPFFLVPAQAQNKDAVFDILHYNLDDSVDQVDQQDEKGFLQKTSRLIVDCTFGKEVKKDKEGKDVEVQQCGLKHLFQLATNVMKLLLWLAVTGAGVLIFWKGVRLAANMFFQGGYSAAREDLQKSLKSVLIGLLLILSAYLIVKSGFSIIGYKGDPFAHNDPAKQTRIPTTPGSDQQPGTSTIPTPPSQGDVDENDNTASKEKCVQKTGVKNRPCVCEGCETLNMDCKNNCKVSPSIKGKLENLNSEISGIKVTEAWPTTSGHYADCHYGGTCVDINFNPPGYNYKTEDNIKKVIDFIKKAHNEGLYAVYEVPEITQKFTERFADERLEVGTICVNPNGSLYEISDITPHFSVYLDNSHC